MTAKLGYARVSTVGQNLNAQLSALRAAGADPAKIFTDKLSGSANTGRSSLTAMLDYARPGDTLVVAAIDRLGRSVAEVTRTIAELGERRIILRALREGVDTETPRPVAQWLPSWPSSPNSNSSWAGSVAPHLASPAERVSCRQPSRLS
jgi:DNA invertase Pin-like site-specific DNA recombinase